MTVRRLLVVVALAALLLSLFGAETVPAQDAPPEDALLAEKCGLCHSGHRIYILEPAKLKETIERMRSKNPDWISTIQSEHIARVVAKIANDPNVIAIRLAWTESVGRGTALFNDQTLGKKGVSCSSCHKKPEAFRQIEDTYPRWNAKLKRFVGLDETILTMMREKVGADVAATDQRLMDLLIYLKSR